MVKSSKKLREKRTRPKPRVSCTNTVLESSFEDHNRLPVNYKVVLSMDIDDPDLQHATEGYLSEVDWGETVMRHSRLTTKPGGKTKTWLFAEGSRTLTAIRKAVYPAKHLIYDD